VLLTIYGEFWRGGDIGTGEFSWKCKLSAANVCSRIGSRALWKYHYCFISDLYANAMPFCSGGGGGLWGKLTLLWRGLACYSSKYRLTVSLQTYHAFSLKSQYRLSSLSAGAFSLLHRYRLSRGWKQHVFSVFSSTFLRLSVIG